MEPVAAHPASHPRAVVRRMRPADLEAVVAIESESFSTPWHLDTFEALVDRDGVEFLVLDDPEDGVIGYAVLWCVLDQGELANIAVAPEVRGRGLGAFLLKQVIETGRRNGVISLYLEVRESNTGAVKLYEGFGFRDVGRRRDYYQKPREDARVMELRLD